MIPKLVALERLRKARRLKRSTLTAAQLAAVLAAIKPVDIYTNQRARNEWYELVSRITMELLDHNPTFNATDFHDTCGVPT